MKIPEPAIRFRPFSHNPGAHCMLPGSCLSCRIFPSKVCVYDQQQKDSQLIAEYFFLDLGPLQEFTVIQDLERGGIFVSGFTSAAYMQYRIIPVKETVALDFLKVPKPLTLSVSENGKTKYLKIEKRIGSEKYTFVKPQERLFLGSTKAQKWPHVRFREDVKEILPHLYALSQTIPGEKNLELDLDLKEFLLKSFTDMLVPQIFDTNFLGYLPHTFSENTVPIDILRSSFWRIRELFFIETATQFYFIPTMPTSFTSGMLSKIKTKAGHQITIEWTRASPRRVWIESAIDDVVTCVFPKSVASFRLGVRRIANTSTIQLRAKHSYLLDRFEK